MASSNSDIVPDDDDREWPAWFPENPYFRSAFPMTTREYTTALPDHLLRTAISGCVGRWVFQATRRRFMAAWRERQNELEHQIEKALGTYPEHWDIDADHDALAQHIAAELRKTGDG